MNKYKLLIKNIINKTYCKYNHLLFIDYILKNLAIDLKEYCDIITYGTDIVIIYKLRSITPANLYLSPTLRVGDIGWGTNNESKDKLLILAKSKVNDYLKVRSLTISNYKKVNKYFKFLDYTFIIGDKVYINSSFINIKRQIKYILKSSYNLSSNELIGKLYPIIRK